MLKERKRERNKSGKRSPYPTEIVALQKIYTLVSQELARLLP